MPSADSSKSQTTGKSMSSPQRQLPIGGVVHTYQKYNPTEFPSPMAEPPDMVSGAFEHALAYGKYRELTEDELARAIRIDPSQIGGLGPSIDMLSIMGVASEAIKNSPLPIPTTRGLPLRAAISKVGSSKDITTMA